MDTLSRRLRRSRSRRSCGQPGILARGADRRPAQRGHVLARGAGFRADLQGLGRVQFRPGHDGAVRGPDLRRADRARRADLGAPSSSPSRSWWLLAFAVERLVLRPLVNQEQIILFMATIGIAFFLDGFGQIVWGGDVHTLDIGLPKAPMIIGGVAGQRVRPRGARSSRARWSRRSRSSSRGPRSAARSAPSRTTTRRRNRSAFRSSTIWVIVWSVAGVVALVAGIMWGTQSRRAVLARRWWRSRRCRC